MKHDSNKKYTFENELKFKKKKYKMKVASNIDMKTLSMNEQPNIDIKKLNQELNMTSNKNICFQIKFTVRKKKNTKKLQNNDIKTLNDQQNENTKKLNYE